MSPEDRRAAEYEAAAELDLEVELAAIDGVDLPIWIAVDMDGTRHHGPATYREVARLVADEQRAFAGGVATPGQYLPRSIVRSDRPIARAGDQWSTRWVNS